MICCALRYLICVYTRLRLRLTFHTLHVWYPRLRVTRWFTLFCVAFVTLPFTLLRFDLRFRTICRCFVTLPFTLLYTRGYPLYLLLVPYSPTHVYSLPATHPVAHGCGLFARGALDSSTVDVAVTCVTYSTHVCGFCLVTAHRSWILRSTLMRLVHILRYPPLHLVLGLRSCTLHTVYRYGFVARLYTRTLCGCIYYTTLFYTHAVCCSPRSRVHCSVVLGLYTLPFTHVAVLVVVVVRYGYHSFTVYVTVTFVVYVGWCPLPRCVGCSTFFHVDCFIVVLFVAIARSYAHVYDLRFTLRYVRTFTFTCSWRLHTFTITSVTRIVRFVISLPFVRCPTFLRYVLHILHARDDSLDLHTHVCRCCVRYVYYAPCTVH